MTAPQHTSPGRALRRAAAALAVVVGAGALLLGVPASALAHDGLVATSPAAGATVDAAPAAVELDFTGEPLPIGTLVAVTGPDGADVSDGDAEIRGTTVVQRLTAEPAAGAYRVDWRSTSSDGHALTGTFDFTVAGAAGEAAASGAPAVPTTPGDGAATGTTGTDTTRAGTVSGATATGEGIAPVWIGAGAVVLVAAGALLVGRLRRRG